MTRDARGDFRLSDSVVWTDWIGLERPNA